MNYRQIKAIEQKNKQRILEVCPDACDVSGIYILTRAENGFKYAYIGQAKHILSRLAQHMKGYPQHIDASIKKHGLYNESNPCGWDIIWRYFPVNMLDEMEQKSIMEYANLGYQLLNKTTGSQGEGKRGLGEQKSPKGYRDGLSQGYKNAQKFVANLFDKHLTYGKKSEKSNKLQEKALEKFEEFLDWREGE